MRRLALAMVLLASPRGAAAQSGDRWLIVSVASPADSWVVPTTTHLYDEIVARGVGVWSPDDAKRRFEADGSAPAPVLASTEKAKWIADSKEVLERLVRGKPHDAHELIVARELLSLPKVTALNRDPQEARRVLDTCLLGVRALIEIEATEEARAMARDCRRLVVVGEPSLHMHPPPVTDLLAEADRERAAQATVLHVDSSPLGCGVRANGLRSGETPLAQPGLVPGRYAIQVECDAERQGRVHYIEVEPGFTEIAVDARFDDAVGTQPTLGLRYSDAERAEEHRKPDAERITEVLSATGLILASTPYTGAVELELLRVPDLERTAFARIKSGPSGPTLGDISLAARALIDDRCMDLTTLPATVLPCGEEVIGATAPEDAWPAARMPRGKLISGMTLFAAGSASLLTGYVLLGPRARASENWVRALDAGLESASEQQRWFNMGIGIVVTASVGAGALVTAMPLVLPKKAKTPWWAWLSGGLGVGFAAFSIGYGVTAEGEPGISCSSLILDANDARTCVKRGERISVAVLTGATAAPLLTIPLVYLLRPSKSKLRPEIEVSRRGGYLAVRGEF